VKATVVVRLKREVLDPQGDAVRKSLAHLGFEGVKDVRIGKLVEIELEDGVDPAALKERLAKMADAILVNPVVEDGEILV
jgi:phosphoribosylformylglycinamidine synthase PurS subunit